MGNSQEIIDYLNLLCYTVAERPDKKSCWNAPVY